MKANKILYTIALAIVLLAGGPAAWAANTWTVQYVTSSGKFKITRSGDTSITETVKYRTVSLSAIAGQHFAERTGTVTFGPGDSDKEIAVTENAPGTAAYLYQNGTSRKYRFEVLDQGGFRLAYTDRTITTGTSVPSSGLFSEKDITIFTSGTEFTDDGYDQSTNPHYINSSSYYNLSGIAPAAYYTLIGAQLRSTLSLEAREENNGYQYVQILINNTSTCDNRSKCDDGDPGNINLSRYMAGFDHEPSKANTNYATYTFPVTSQPNNCSAVSNAWDNGVTNKLYTQKFNTSYNCRATDGRLIIPVDFEKFVVRFNASGGGTDHDEWLAKNVVAHIQAVDGTAPTVLGDPVVSGSMHAKGNTFYVSVPFREIVTVSGTPTLSTTWGSMSYVSSNGGSGSNVLTFSGTITADAGTTLTVQSISGTIKDLAKNELSSSSKTINKSYSTTVDASHSFTLSYDLAGGTVATANPDNYTYETAAFTLSNPARTGYWFDGWTGSNGSTPSTTVTIANHSHGDKTYAANWTKVWTGSGTQGDPYVITTAKGLDLLAMYVNGLNGNTAHNCSGVYFQLGGNIDYNPTDAWNLASSTENNYTAIGTSSSNFQGTFDGQNYTISGIRIYKGGDTDAYNYYLGLFGRISDGTVRGVNLADARITGRSYVGGIAGGIFQTTVEDCSVAADVCIHAVQMNSSSHGGIVGSNQGSVWRCLSRATLSVANATACNEFGAIAGNVQGNIYDCIAVGAIVPDISHAGALFGYYNGNPRRNYYRACTVAGTANATGVGVGSDSGNSSPHDLTANQGAQALYSITLPDGVTLVRSASATLPGTGNATYTTGADIDGMPYAFDGATLRLSYTGDAPAEGYKTAIYVNGVQATDNGNGTYTATMPPADATVSVSTVPDYAYFWGDGNDGSLDHPYTITTPEGLVLLSTEVNNGKSFYQMRFVLGADIDMSGVANFTPIGIDVNEVFSGTGFYGQGHTISNLTVSTDGDAGLFGTANTLITNVILDRATITTTDGFAGGIAANMVANLCCCLVLNSTITTGNGDSGAIVGNIALSSSNYNNYYYNCTVNGQHNGIGVGGIDNGVRQDISENDGAVQVFALNPGAGISASAIAAVTHQGTEYYTAGTTVTLSGTGSAPAGYQEPFLGYSLNGTPFDGNSFTMPAADATVTARWTLRDFTSGHAGTEADPYIIYNSDQLNLLATRVNSGTGYSGKFIKLGADIEYDGTENNYTPIGTNPHPFRGTFDGDGHAVSGICIMGNETYQGFFGHITGTAKNVVIANSTISGYDRIGVIVGNSANGTVQNCLVINCSIQSTDTDNSGIIAGESGVLSHNYYYNCTANGHYMNVGIDMGDKIDNDGAVRAVTSTTKPAEIGAQIATYPGGLTVYEHGAYYNGTYYLRHDLAGTAVGLTLTQGTKDGVSAWWGTWFDSATNYTLSESATAYTLGSDFKLYRLGTDGRTIPKGVAVVIIATSADAALIPAGTGDLSIDDHAPGGNILVGNDTATSYSTIYVLSVSSGEIGFRKLSTGTLPAHKAGYELEGMQDYDKQDNQEW